MHHPVPSLPLAASHSGEKLAPTLPQFTLRPEVKIEDLGESGAAPAPQHLHPAAAWRGVRASSPPRSAHRLSLPAENFNPEIPKLEKSISGTSPKREHLPLAVAAALFLMTLLAS